jgi:hypothetical protein
VRQVLILCLVLGCTCVDTENGSRDLTVPRLPPSNPPEQPVVAQPVGAPAPSRALWGLELGSTEEDGLSSWVEAQGIDCEALTAPRRETEQLRCTLDTLPAAMTHRQPGEAQSFLLLVRPDEGPLHHISILRRHLAPAAALLDFSAAGAAVSAQLGPPTRADPRPPATADLASAQVRFSSTWSFSDLQVELSLSRMGGEQLVVRERWDVPGVEAGVAPRPGSIGHAPAGGVAPHSPHGIVPRH